MVADPDWQRLFAAQVLMGKGAGGPILPFGPGFGFPGSHPPPGAGMGTGAGMFMGGAPMGMPNGRPLMYGGFMFGSYPLGFGFPGKGAGGMSAIASAAAASSSATSDKAALSGGGAEVGSAAAPVAAVDGAVDGKPASDVKAADGGVDGLLALARAAPRSEDGEAEDPPEGKEETAAAGNGDAQPSRTKAKRARRNGAEDKPTNIEHSI
jgi:hypothetical protein